MSDQSAHASRPARALGADTLTLCVAALLALVYSAGFWRHLQAADAGGVPLLFAAFVVLLACNALLLSFFGWHRVQKPALAVVLLLSAMAAYFIDAYGAVIDRHALQSVLETDAREAAEWLSPRLFAYVAALGVLPGWLVLRTPVRYRPWPRELGRRAAFFAAMGLLLAAAVLPFSRDMASLARNHPELRDLAVPFNIANAVRGYLKHAAPVSAHVDAVGADARGGSRFPHRDPVVLVIVVGESARASSFSLDGYARDTNPELSALRTTWFPSVHSCGTNTATSVPCMFSDLGRRDFNEADAASRENLLDVIRRAGLRVEWEDNNTGSKGVARRVGEERMAAVERGSDCDTSACLDEILARHLRRELARTAGDSVFVLHQVGSHGPAYFQRYPPRFERFVPTCRSVSLQDCTQDQIRNTYDNTILYTDHVLAELIRILDEEAGDRATALLYVSDHGESTGEHGLYLHGAPYAFAPEEQTRVPMLLWTSTRFDRWRQLDGRCVDARRSAPLSHDNVFHSVLGLLDIRTAAYRPALDAFAGCAPA